jgi:RimJ/RimL family protein N-acetyltransferase
MSPTTKTNLPLPKGLASPLVALRPFAEEDADAILRACRDPLIRRFTLFPEPRNEAEVRAWIQGHAGARGRGVALDLAITRPVDDVVVGAVGLVGLAFEHRRAQAGFWLAPSARGQGLATEALRLLSAWAFSPPLELGGTVISMPTCSDGALP